MSDDKKELKREAEARRLLEMSGFERPLWQSGLNCAGMDEVGRGPLAGPVVAACVMMPPECLIEGVKDSKKISKKRLAELYDQITSKAAAWGVGIVDEKTIDRINILQATKLAFRLAYLDMNVTCGTVFVDAVKDLDIDAKQVPIIKGDALCYSIACASIVAKVTRDRMMIALAEKYPGYGFERNVGYGTQEHLDALFRQGPCAIHRLTFLKNFADRLPKGGPDAKRTEGSDETES